MNYSAYISGLSSVYIEEKCFILVDLEFILASQPQTFLVSLKWEGKNEKA